MNNISVVMVVKGYSEYVFKTLESVRSLASEILIGDIGIDEELLAKLKKIENIKIVTVTKKVPYVELIREELHAQAKGDYILVLDPDEIVPPSLTTLLESSVGKYDYVKVPRKNIIFGKWIEHSRWWPDYQVRFFKKGSVVWPKVLHAQPKVDGSELLIEPSEENAIVHHNYKDLDEYLSKAPRYAKAEAAGILKPPSEGRQVQDDNDHEIDISFTYFSKKALSEFIGRYFADDGYKDGMHGFVLAFLQMMYYFLVYFYVWELGGRKEVEQKSLLQNTLQFFSDALYEISFWGKKQGLSNISFVKSKLHNLVRKLS
ncbi:MAG: glycosyltransferase [Microgenomates group bacterium]